MEINRDKFIKIVENLVDGEQIQDIFFFQKFRKFLPQGVFNYILNKTAKKTPYIGFIIEPYSLFLFYKILDVEKAKSMLPKRYELTKASIFEGDEPDYYFGFGILNTRGSTFWGVRLESYLIARDTKTGLLSWIFFDILSNTIIAIPSLGIKDPNSKKAIFTTTHTGDIYVDIKEDKTSSQINLKCNLNNGVKRRPDQELWVTGNTSIGHINALINKNDDPFAVIFDPGEVSSALDVPVSDICTTINTLIPDFAEKEPCRSACFPFTQHYIADSPGCRTYVKDTNDLIEKYKAMTELNQGIPFSTKKIKALFYLSIFVSPLITLGLLIYFI